MTEDAIPSAPRGATRRQAFVAGATLAAASAGFVGQAAAQSGCSPEQGGDDLVTTPPEAVVRTASGQVRGFKRTGVFIFKGVPYGADTGGSARFLPPRPAPAWDEVRLCLTYGLVSPQPTGGGNPMFSGNGEALAFVNDGNASQPGENCLTLNVWSASLDPSAKRPVMVWLHGGGFTSGSSGAMPSYDGENLARRGVVLVSLNHRLGPVGFMDLSAVGGPAFAKSGNVGMLDLVLGLQWVRDNIAGFGGDPGRITIFGQSGGGGKVSTLMAMPDAKGLFHRGVVMSGSFPAGTPAVEAQALAAATIAELGLQPGDVAGLQNVEAGKLIAAANAAAHKLSQGPAGAPSAGMARLTGFGPVLDGAVLPEDWQSAAPRISADVPMIIGNTRDEFRPPNLSYTEATLPNAVPPPRRAQAAEIIAALRKAFPDLPPTELGAIIGAMFMRNMSVGQATKKQALGAAPVYSYWYVWQSPILDGRIGAPHGSDIPAAFDNTRKSDQFTGNTLEAQRLATIVSQAWINFAATGDPSQPGLPWPAFNPERVPTMVFDNRVRVEDDPAGDARRMLA